jgi:hypothetical protein
LNDPLDLHLKHFTDDLRVFITLGGFVPLDGLGCPGVTKVVVDLRKFVLPSPLWGFDSRNRTKSW